MRIEPPPQEDLADRQLTCKDAIQRAYQDLIEEAVTAGWSEAESVAAIIELSKNHVLAKSENDRLNEALAELTGRRPCGPLKPFL